MKARTVIASALAAAMLATTVSLFAGEPAPAGAKRSTEPIYGYRMMSDQERDQYRERMRAARGAEERQAVRDEHHKQMDERMRERGATTGEDRGLHGRMAASNGRQMHDRGPKGPGPANEAGRGNCSPPADCPSSGGPGTNRQR